MKSYSEDLRKKKIVAAVERGTSKSEIARLFGVSLSPVKRYVAMASSAGSPSLPRRGPAAGLLRKCTREHQQKAFERGHEGAPRCDHRPEDPLPGECHGEASELLDRLASVEAPGMEPKKRAVGASERDEWLRAAWRVMVSAQVDPERLVFVVDEMGTNTSLSPVYAWAPKGRRAYCSGFRATAGRTRHYSLA